MAMLGVLETLGIAHRRLFEPDDRMKTILTGDNNYRIRLPKDVPANMFWSLTVYDNDTRSMIRNQHGRPLVGSGSAYAFTAQDADGAYLFVSIIFKRFVHIILANHARAVVVIVYIKHHGLETHV